MIVGIDLGTTNSLIAYYSEEGPKIIPNRLGKNLTPSIVSLDAENQICVGEQAVEQILLDPGCGASLFKRSMGSDKKFQMRDQSFTAEELSSFVLRYLKEDAESYLGEPITEAVISVPAYFNDMRRRATKRAGELAGLKVERIISEPTAAAVAYGLWKTKGQAKYLVFDLGGGTFDVSVLELFDTILEVHAVAGDNFLGGEDFTLVLEKMFYQEHPELDEYHLSEKTRKHIHRQAELCKIGLGTGNHSEMRCVIDGQEIVFPVELSDYEDACEDLLERIRQPIKRSLKDAHIRLSDIDKVVFVGGATKSEVIRKFASKLFRRLPDFDLNPDETVAIGAAIQAAMKERKDAVREVILTDVCPFTLGTEVVEEYAKDCYETGVFLPIIERNTIIPASRTQRLYTVKDKQTQIRVHILQGESRLAANNLSLGEMFVDLPSANAGEEAVDVTYTYDINSILEVEVTSVSSGKKVRRIFKDESTRLSREEIEERLKTLSYLKIHPRDKEENKVLLLRGERLYEESLGQKREIAGILLRNFEHALNTYDPEEIAKAKEKMRQFLEDED